MIDMTADAEPQHGNPQRAGAERDAAQPLILIVEDEYDTLIAISAILADAGYRTVEAHSGFMALDRARQTRPHLVLLDLGLPEINGLDVARLLNDDERTASIPIVALTGSWLADNPANLQSAGFVGALRKPFRALELVTLVRRVLQDREHVDP